MPRHCLPLANGGFACGNLPSRLICDVCDRPVKGTAPKFSWRGIDIDLCPGCRTRYEADEPGFRAFADKVIAKYYTVEAAQR
jgi:hypothetical protein